MIRVLHMLDGLDRGGIETMLINLYRHIDRDQVQFDFLLTNPHHCEYEDEVIALGGRIYRAPRFSFLRPDKYIRAVDCFFATHPEYRIVHSHSTAKSAIPLSIAKKYGVPVRIAHAHINQGGQWWREMLQSIMKLRLNHVCTHRFACSTDAAEWLFGAQNISNTRIIINAIELDKYQYNKLTRTKMRSQLGIPEQTFVCGHIGRFTEQKNHIFLLDIFAAIHRVKPDAKLILIGKGPLEQDIKAKIAALHLNNDVIMTGEIDNVQDYLQVMDAFVFPSLFEGLGMVLIEAQAAGLPCYTSLDKVPAAAAVTKDLVRFLPLENNADLWAKTILDTIPKQRISHIREVRAAGYDVIETAKQIQHFYLNV